MPFRSARQRRWMYANKPRLAKRWAKKYGAKIKRKRRRGIGRKKKGKR